MTNVKKKIILKITLIGIKDHGLSPGYFTEKYSHKKDIERQKRQVKYALPQTKRRRLELKQERLTQKGAREAAEGDTYQSGTFLLNNILVIHLF